VILAVLKNPPSIGVVPDHASCSKWKWCAHGRQVLQNVIRPTTIGMGFLRDAGKHVFLWVEINHLDIVNDEVPPLQVFQNAE